MVVENVGVVEFAKEINVLPVVIGIALVLVGLLGFAALWMKPEQRINTADGTGKEGPVPAPPGKIPPPSIRLMTEDEVRTACQGLEEELDADYDRQCQPLDMPDVIDEGNREGVSCLRARPGLSGCPEPSGEMPEMPIKDSEPCPAIAEAMRRMKELRQMPEVAEAGYEE